MISPPPRPLRLALHGAGPHSRGLLMPALSGLDHPLEAVCDPRVNLADDLAERFAFRATFSDLPSLLRDTAVETLVISRDTPNLPDIIDPLLGSRIPFWVDAGTPGLDKLLERLRRRRSNNGPTYMICHPHRFAPAFGRAAELLRSGRLGRLLLGSLEISLPKAAGTELDLPLEYLLEGALDLLSFLLGRPQTVYACWDGISALAGIIRFDQMSLTLQLRRGVWPGQAEHLLCLHGQEGEQLQVRNLLDMSACQGESILARHAGPMASSKDLCAEHGWTMSLAAFFAAAGLSGQVFPDMTGFLVTRKAAQAVIRSAGSGREISLPF